MIDKCKCDRLLSSEMWSSWDFTSSDSVPGYSARWYIIGDRSMATASCRPSKGEFIQDYRTIVPNSIWICQVQFCESAWNKQLDDSKHDDLELLDFPQNMGRLPSLKLTDRRFAPENWWLRRWSFPFGMSDFHGRTVSLPEGSHSHFPAMKEDDFKKLAVLGWCIEWLQVGVRFRWRDVTYHIHVRYNATYIYTYLRDVMCIIV